MTAAKRVHAGQGLFLLAMLLFMVMLCMAVPDAGAGQTPPKKKILVLNSYHKGLSWTDNIVKGIDEVLQPDIQQYEVHYEYMDTKRHYDRPYYKQLYETYLQKYRNERFDVILACDNDAFMFVKQHRKSVFRDSPVVFCGINYFKDSMVEGMPRVTGVVEETDIRSTLEVALKVMPEVTQVVVINDQTTTGVAMRHELEEVMPYFQGVDFVFFDDFDIAELREKVRTLPRHSLILLIVVNRDRTGNFFAYEESLSVIRQEAKVPIFSLWDFYMGGGTVGGMLTSGYYQGKTAAELAQRILKGEDVSRIPIVRKSPNKYMFDYRELQRFHIKPQALPKDSEISFVPDTLFTKYKTFIYWIAITISTLSGIIFILLANISKRKEVERALRESEEKYRDLYDNAPDMYYSLNEEGVFVDCNETEAKMLGYSKGEIIGRHIKEFLTEPSRRAHDELFPTLLKEQKALQGVEREFVRKDGSIILVSLNLSVEIEKNKKRFRTKTIGRDVTESKRLENDLKVSREELRNLYTHLQSVREEERRMVASEIHDELGQVLTTLKLDLTLLKQRLVKEQSPLAKSVKTMADLVDLTIESVQRISSELRPGVLDHLGLSDAIEWLAGEVCSRKGMQFDVTIHPEDISLDQNRSIGLFRIFQEALTNVVRHADATMVEIMLTRLDGMLTLEVKDNGCGIPEDKLTHHKSYGLMGIRERARYLGGTVRITGLPDKGTTVSVEIPLGEEEKDYAEDSDR